MQATRPRNHKLTYIQSRHPIAQLQTMSFMKTEVPIITICLHDYFTYGSVALVLLALVDCFKPARFYDKRRQPLSLPTGPQLSCSLARKSARNQTPILWHLKSTRLTCGVSSGDMFRMSRNNQRIGVSNLKFFHSMQLQDTGRSWQSALPMVHRQYNMHGLPYSRLPLAQQQAVSHQLQQYIC